RCLGGRIGHHEVRDALAEDGGDVDDRAALLRRAPAPGRLGGGQPYAAQVGLHGRVEVGGAHVDGRAFAADAGVVDYHVYRTPIRLDGIEGRVAGGVAA